MPILLYNKRMKSKAVGCCDYNASHQRSVRTEGDKSDVAIINISCEVTAFCNVAYYLYDKRIKLVARMCALHTSTRLVLESNQSYSFLKNEVTDNFNAVCFQFSRCVE